MQTAVKEQPVAPASNSVRVEIFDQGYNLRGSDADYIRRLAEFVDTKMRLIAEQTSTVDSLRLAVLAALNIADEYHLLKRKLENLGGDYLVRAQRLSGALDEVLQEHRRVGERSA
jgi:cell division protein ZapA